MATVKRSVYLISEQQRTALLKYLQERPYQEVASGIEFLLKAPTANIDVEVPDDAVTETEESAQDEQYTKAA